MGILNEVSDEENQHDGQKTNVALQKKRASFPSRERHYAVRRKTRSHSPPFHRCNRVPPQLPPAELQCDCDYGDSSEERQGVLYCISFEIVRIEFISIKPHSFSNGPSDLFVTKFETEHFFSYFITFQMVHSCTAQ